MITTEMALRHVMETAMMKTRPYSLDEDGDGFTCDGDCDDNDSF